MERRRSCGWLSVGVLGTEPELAIRPKNALNTQTSDEVKIMHHLPLGGLRVIGLEQSVAAPLCTRILTDLGADVIKVERAPSGDFARHWDDNARGQSAQFWWLNGQKRSIGLDLHKLEDRATLDRLMTEADVLVHNMSPAAADRLGLTEPKLGSQLPYLIVCQISGYGNESTPYRDRKAYDMLIQAESGMMSLTGSPEQPSRVGVSICDVATGLYAAILVLAALQSRQATGKGAWLDVAMLDASVEFLGPMLISYLNSGIVYPRIPDRHHAIAPYGAFRCADGRSIVIAIEQEDEWKRFCASVLRDDELSADPRFVTNETRRANQEALNAIVKRAFGEMTFDTATATLDELGLAYGALNTVADLAEHSVLEARSMIQTVRSSNGEDVQTIAGLGARAFGNDASEAERARPPDLGEDGQELPAWRTDSPILEEV